MTSQTSLINAVEEYLTTVDRAPQCRRICAPISESLERLRRAVQDVRTDVEQIPRTLAFAKILIAIDASEPSRWALSVGGRLAAQCDARVVLLHVVDMSKGLSPELGFVPDQKAAELRDIGVELVREARSQLPEEMIVEREVRDGEPSEQIVATAQDCNADLIVVGTHSHGRLARFLLGSTAEHVVRRAGRPVLTVGQEPADISDSKVSTTHV